MTHPIKKLRIASYNIHKGMSLFSQRLVLHDVQRALASLEPDLVFLQEVQGQHLQKARRFAAWPEAPQHEFLAGSDMHCAYGLNASHDDGHHGNALLSRYPIHHIQNINLTLHRFEQRGLLHCTVHPKGWARPLHALCVHLNLLGRDRRRQISILSEHIRQHIPQEEALVLAGDFNDWRREASHLLHEELGLIEVFETLHGCAAKSFPARLPMLHLDRIYIRGLSIESAEVLGGVSWRKLSDHAPLFSVLQREIVPL